MRLRGARRRCVCQTARASAVKPLIFHSAASQEFEAAITFYEGARRGLGEALLAEVERATRHNQDHPQHWRALQGDWLPALRASALPIRSLLPGAVGLNLVSGGGPR